MNQEELKHRKMLVRIFTLTKEIVNNFLHNSFEMFGLLENINYIQI